MKKIIEMNNVTKIFMKDNKKIIALKNINISFCSGKVYIILGESGAGKSTLLNCLSLIELITFGEIIYNGKKASLMNEKDKSNYRRNIGFIFQNYFLDNYLNALENVMLPLLLTDKSLKNCEQEAQKALEYVGLKSRLYHYPTELSGGEQQRVAIARAIVTNPAIILADEPTGNLDSKNESIVLEYIKNMAASGKCVIIVTHSSKVKKLADVLIVINKGKLVISNGQ